MGATCSCERSAEGKTENHVDGTVTFHTFAGCPRVKPCEHIKKQSDVSLVGPDGRCTKCSTLHCKAPGCGKDLRRQGQELELKSPILCPHCGAENVLQISGARGSGGAVSVLRAQRPKE
ncbi:hypothetical protein [Anaeromyxobacter diazotrophicus]|uniref:Uncharacterized protein n=1 Tax=Anaeromyxobacter diazotrophicus TaxID=2590199 RepID=A0A7I9VKL4_9BACT|nr:hypothetical protein [Anaeromyxobacter diazotrophicus]GEJ56943.1 hypothetical protein AMYX_16840 [Anaeromyxobacter diazotrophicus]